MVQKVLPSPILPQVTPRTLDGVIMTSGVTTRQTLDVMREHARAINANIDDVDALAGQVASLGVWSAYTPIVTPQSGAFGSLGTLFARYTRIGNLVFLGIEIDIITVGSATGILFFSVPIPGASISLGTAREVNVNGSMGWVQVTGGQGVIVRYDNAPLMGDGYGIRGNVFYGTA